MGSFSRFVAAVDRSTGLTLKILVTGASSMIGEFLLPMLVDAGYEVVVTSRTHHVAQYGVRWLQLDFMHDQWAESVGEVDLWVNLTSILLLPGLLPGCLTSLKVKRLMAFSSTSKFTKKDAKSEQDRQLAEALDAAEGDVRACCEENGVDWVIFRPTMIYCLNRDKNISLIVEKIRRFHFFPLISSGCGLRQPVHAEDLAQACVQAIGSEGIANKGYNLSGGEVLSYRAMVERLFECLGMRAVLVPVPLGLLRMCIALLRIFPRYRYLSADMADRMRRDMVFSHEEASRDFGYSPGPFRPLLKRGAGD